MVFSEIGFLSNFKFFPEISEGRDKILLPDKYTTEFIFSISTGIVVILLY